MFYPSSCAFCLRSPWKRLCRQVVALFDLMASLSGPGSSPGSMSWLEYRLCSSTALIHHESNISGGSIVLKFEV